MTEAFWRWLDRRQMTRCEAWRELAKAEVIRPVGSGVGGSRIHGDRGYEPTSPPRQFRPGERVQAS